MNISKSLYYSRQTIYLSNSFFSKNSIEQIFLNVKKYHFVTLKKKLLPRIFRKYEIKKAMSISSPVQILKHFHRWKLEKLQKKEGKYQKRLIFLTRRGNDVE